MAGKTGNQWETFGTFAQDANREKMSNFPNNFITTDSSGSAKTSPLTVSSSVVDIAVPVAAVQMQIQTNANALRISELSDASKYYLLPASGSITIPVARQQHIYLLRDSSDCTVQFMFYTV